MSWNLRDYRQGKVDTPSQELPPREYHDDAPLPTYADGLEVYSDDEDEQWRALPSWQRRQMRDQGLLTEQELDQWSLMMRRGIDAV